MDEKKLEEVRKLALAAAAEKQELRDWSIQYSKKLAELHLPGWVGAIERAALAKEIEVSLSYDIDNEQEAEALFKSTMQTFIEDWPVFWSFDQVKRELYAKELERLLGEPFTVHFGSGYFEIYWEV
jgi:hypothetical protein